MCWYCGNSIGDEEPLGRSLRCAHCGRDLRVCRHCRFYLPGSRGDCRESSADPPQDKERANFCDWFSLDHKFRALRTGEKSPAQEVSAKAASAKAASAKSAFDDLFT